MYYRITDDTENYANFLPSNYTDESFEPLDGQSRIATWQGLHFELTDKEDVRPIPDFFAADMPACSERLFNVLKDICKDSVEFLPCTVGDDKLPFYVMNVIVKNDVVDYESSSFQRFPSSGRIMFFNKICFNTEIKDSFFKIPDLINTHVFCTDSVKNALEKADAKGVAFSDSLF